MADAKTLTNDPLLWCQPIRGDHNPEEIHLESWWIFYRDPPLRSLEKKLLERRTQDCSPYRPQPNLSPCPSPRSIFLASLSFSPKPQGPFFWLCILFPEPISSIAHLFYLCDLNKLFLIVWISALNYILAGTQIPMLLNWGLVWLHQSNNWHCFAANTLTSVHTPHTQY